MIELFLVVLMCSIIPAFLFVGMYLGYKERRVKEKLTRTTIQLKCSHRWCQLPEDSHYTQYRVCKRCGLKQSKKYALVDCFSLPYDWEDEITGFIHEKEMNK